jgi:ribosomal protein S18 acetylase RimI-like enzyme
MRLDDLRRRLVKMRARKEGEQAEAARIARDSSAEDKFVARIESSVKTRSEDHLIIRPVEAHDLPAVVAMVSALAAQDGVIATTTAEALTRDLLASGVDAWLVLLVAERSSDGMLVGYALMLRTYGITFAEAVTYLEQLYIMPEARRCGAGAVLVRAACKRARDWGCTTLRINVLARNVKAQRFYKALGIQEERSAHLTRRLLHGALYALARTTGWPHRNRPLRIDLTTAWH